MRRNGLDERKERDVEQQDLVPRVIEDVGKLLRMQAGIAGMKHSFAARHGEVGFEMPVVIPRERGDPHALLHTQLSKRTGKTPRSLRGITKRIAVQRTAGFP